MTKYFCDFCKQETEYVRILNIRTDPAAGTRNAMDEHKYELCGRCSLAIYHMMTGELSADDIGILSERIGR